MNASTFPVRQGVDPRYLRSTLTKDISPLEALFDLVDNSVDAARERRVARDGGRLDRHGLPNDYSGSHVRVRIGRDSVTLSDNCTGIDEDKLAKEVFVTGLASEHNYGIGGFGIGLKRALFRIGTRYTLATDTGISASIMRFDRAELSGNESTLTAERAPTSGAAKTFVRIDGLEPGVKHELGSMPRPELVKHLSRRYGLFIKKGLRISVNGLHVPPFGPGLRRTGPLESKTQSMRTRQEVDVFIDSGMHEDYRLRHESDYAASKTAQLTDQYGWYFVCNDRIVKIASHEKELGWTANWHQEYYGFVGWVRFVAANPEDLPWDTKKTQIDSNSAVFREICDKLQEFAEAYKVGNKKARKEKLHEPSIDGKVSGNDASKLEVAGAVEPASVVAANGKPPPAKAPSPQRNAKDHNEHWDTLLPAMEVAMTHPKIRAMVFEATGLSVGNPYAGSMLFRAIVEFALFERLKRTGNYSSVREMYFEQQREANRTLAEEQKKKFRPTFAHAMEWLNKNDDYFPADVRRECVTARNKFGAHIKELNGVVHEGDLIDSGKLKIIRNDTLPLLRFLLAV